MHKSIRQIQERSLPNKLRANVMAETAQAIQNLINQADPIPGVGKLVVSITVEDGVVGVEMGIRKGVEG